VEAYRSQHDPGFNVQHLEDRASVVFWRKVMADRLGQIDPLAKMASPEFCEPYASTLTALDGSRRYVGDCAVGSVDVRGVLSKPPRDAVLVEIRWSGTEFVAERGQPPKRSKRGLAVRQLFVFGRNSGVVTDVGSSVSSSHCPGCGAPESDLTSNACQFCGEVLNDGSHDWVLDQILAMNSPEAQQWLRQLAAETVVEAQVIGPATGPVSSQADEPPRGKELLIWMVKMALADQQLDDRERKLLVRMAENQQVPLDELNALVLSAEQGTLEAPTPANREQGREWLVAMADMSVRDGKVQAAEYQMLRQVGAKLNWTDYDIKRLLRERHTRMYQAARQDLRAARSARSTGESHAT
jgi:hypothetical protein